MILYKSKTADGSWSLGIRWVARPNLWFASRRWAAGVINASRSRDGKTKCDLQAGDGPSEPLRRLRHLRHLRHLRRLRRLRHLRHLCHLWFASRRRVDVSRGWLAKPINHGSLWVQRDRKQTKRLYKNKKMKA